MKAYEPRKRLFFERFPWARFETEWNTDKCVSSIPPPQKCRIGTVYCNAFFFLSWSEQKWQTCYNLFRLHFPLKDLIWVILSRCRICDSRVQWISTPVRWLTATHTPQNIRFICAEEPCWCTTHAKMIITQITAIADFKRKWRQRGNTYGLQL